MAIQTGTIHAAIDLGSNSAKITVAATCEPASQVDNTIEIIAHESTMIRLGESVNATGNITPEKQVAVITTLQNYQQLAQKYQTTSMIVVATEAVRKAENSQMFLKTIQQETGLTVHILSGEREAALTYFGAVSEYQEASDTSVVDIGGGSTEFIIAQQGHIQWLISLPIGSGWLHDHYLSADPPTTLETDNAHTFLLTNLQRLQLPEVASADQAHKRLIATGSSAQSILALAKQALMVDKEKHILSRYDLLGSYGLLSALPATEIARRYRLPLERARVLPGGALILLALMEVLQLQEISVSQRGVSEGALLAALRYGDNWMEHPDVNIKPDVHDISTNTIPNRSGEQAQGPVPTTSPTLPSPAFIETGRQELLKRSEQFVKWIEPVLQNEDVEAVHKMRVASRRLRATLDAYGFACVQKPFKRVYREVKQAADLLGTARDTDVMLQNLEQQQQEAPDKEKPGLQWLINRLQSYRQQQQEAIEAFFKQFHSKRFQQSVASCIPRRGSKRGKS